MKKTLTKTSTRRRKKHHFKIRIEAWDSRGNNLGFRMHTMMLDNLTAAIDEARNMYKTLYIKQDKAMRITNEASEVLWEHKNWDTK